MLKVTNLFLLTILNTSVPMCAPGCVYMEKVVGGEAAGVVLGQTYHSVLLTASPKPGVSTMVSRSFTPFSSMSTACLVISTVCMIRSREGGN